MTDNRQVIPSVAGISALHVLDALAKVVGQDVIDQAQSGLPQEVRDAMSGIHALSWVPQTALNRFIDEVARAAQRDPEPMIDEAVRIATQRTYSTVWRMFLRVTTDEALIKRAPLMHAKTRNVGQLAANFDAPGTARVTLSDWPDVPERTLRTIGVGITSVLELAGRHDVRMSYSRTSDGGRFEIRWRV